ncbi:MAG: tetratricopeptide repeat-containing glycosyltransferase family protein, partial [Magnetovibrio sp.]|nr:tetratricopeptide repeat-containing glycosyltransferase family protein [Magnetovibrio sp.]
PLLGAIAEAQGRVADAIDAFEAAVRLKPEIVTAWVSLANLYRSDGNLEKALAACDAAEAGQPGRPDVMNARGQIHQVLGDWAAAEAAYKEALAATSEPTQQAPYATNLAGLAMVRGAPDAAAELGRAATAAAPGYAPAHNVLGAALLAQGEDEAAQAAFQRALELAPALIDAQVNLGTVLGRRRQWQAALDTFDRALALAPDSAEAWNNRGNVLHGMGRFDEAQAAFERAIDLAPDYADPHLNRGLLDLKLGRWAEGWSGFAKRWQTPQMVPFRRTWTAPEWDGAENPGATLFVHAEQGMGDTLQFVRYLPLAARRVGRVILECQPELIGLLSHMDGVDAVLPRSGATPAFDFQIALLDLPRVFATRPDTVPGNVPYLTPPASASVSVPGGAGLKVGLVWAGNPGNPADRTRSAGLAPLRPLLDVPGCTFYGLQHGETGGQIGNLGLGARIIDLGPQLTDFAATAALVAQLDLVISVCTSVAHLAGGLGAETWIVLSKDADWRWLLDQETTPWYPTARLFRQDTLDDWDELAGRVAGALADRASG